VAGSREVKFSVECRLHHVRGADGSQEGPWRVEHGRHGEGQADAPKVSPDPFWLVLEESGDIGELTLHPSGQDHELLLEALRLEVELAVDPI
jgi:hypothetical protein